MCLDRFACTSPLPTLQTPEKENCTPESFIISDLEGFLFVVSDGESPRSKFEWEHSQTDGRKRSIAKSLGDDDAAGITSLVPGVKNSRLRNGLEWHVFTVRFMVGQFPFAVSLWGEQTVAYFNRA